MIALLGLALADDSFHPGAGPETLRYADLLAGGVVTGRTGRVLARAEPSVLAGVPGRVTPLPGGIVRVEPDAGVDDLALARDLHGRPGVAWAVPDLVLRLVPAMPDDPLAGELWHLENTGQGGRTPDVDVDAETAWAFATGAGQTIAVLDSGVQLDHPDLAVIAGGDYLDDDGDPTPASDSSGPHGTGVAGIAAATGDNGVGVAGVAYGADVYAIRLIGGNASTEDLYLAFVEAVDAGASVLNNSWGFDNCDGVPAMDVFGDMFDYAEDVGRDGLGAAVVFAAGNGGCDVGGDAMLRHRSIVVVSALEWWDSRASYSAYGDPVDVAAPTALLTTDVTPGGYGSYGGDDAYMEGFSGTSGASPVVAGVMALMFDANPRLTAKEAREVLCDTAVRVDLDDAGYDEDGWSPYYGCGRIDAGAAVAAVYDRPPGVPEPRLLADEVEVTRVVLAWEPAADEDGDVLHHVVRWDGGEHVVYGTTLDLTGEVDVGDTVTWTVAGVDPWGEGPSSDPVTFTVVAVAEVAVPAGTTGGCGAGGGAWVLLGGVAATRRRAGRS
ncbi:MAG: S8 family serine peptidase [Myxococcota bacterium]